MKFKAEDFTSRYVCIGEELVRLRAAELANAKLKEWLDAARTVYIGKNRAQIVGESYFRDSIEFDTDGGDTHKAKLVCIEEIKK